MQVGSSEGTQESKGGNSLQELKRRGRMERTREEQEEELSGKLKTLVRFALCLIFEKVSMHLGSAVFGTEVRSLCWILRPSLTFPPVSVTPVKVF